MIRLLKVMKRFRYATIVKVCQATCRGKFSGVPLNGVTNEM